MRLIHLLVIGALVFAAAYVYRIKMESTVRTERVLRLHAVIREPRDGVALLADFRMQPQHPLGADGGFHLDPVDIGRGEHQGADHQEVDEPHGQPPLITSVSEGHAGNAAAACAGASVRSAARSFADRARGLAEISASSGVMGRLVKMAKLGAACATSGRCRDPPPALARSTRKFLTMRTPSEWNDTTASRPPGLSTRSAADSARYSWSSSSLTKIRNAWNVRVAG